MNAVPELLREFLNNDKIIFWGAAIQHDVQMLEYYGITILGVRDLQREIANQTHNYPSDLYDLANAYIQIELSKNDPKIRGLSYSHVTPFFLPCSAWTKIVRKPACFLPYVR
jgi:hypothetical protein